MALQSMKDEPGTSREYETVYILRPDVDNAGVGTLNAKVRQIMEGLGGKVLKVDNWGKRRLAFEIKKQLKGIYLYWHYLATPGVVEEVERNLRMLDNVIRYYTVKIDEDVVTEARPTDLTEEAFAKAGETAADEEEIMTGHARSPFADAEDDDIDPDAEEEALRAAAAGGEAVDADVGGAKDVKDVKDAKDAKDAKDSKDSKDSKGGAAVKDEE